MLHSVYSQAGLAGTLTLGVLLMVTVFAWFVAMAGAASRPMKRNRRVPLIAIMTAVPPSAILYLVYAIVKTSQEYRTSDRGLLGSPIPAARDKHYR
jgi:heme/copper-type cytochrome/quinol oxidase subunit 2